MEIKIAAYIRKANETQEMIKIMVQKVFRAFEKVSRDNIEPFYSKLETIRQKLNDSFEFGKKFAVMGPILQFVEPVVEKMIVFTQTCSSIVSELKVEILDVAFKTSDFTAIFEEKLKHYGNIVNKVAKELENIVSKITMFLNTVQLRQKGLDIGKYKPWNQYQHCSADVCLRLMRRSSALYLDYIFLWKYPHLDDLSSKTLTGTGRWPVPGLFDGYKVRSIAQLSKDEMLLGMRGVAVNAEKSSILVVVDTRSSNGKILKIIQLKKDGMPFQADMGGIVVVKSQIIWISSKDSLYGVHVSDLRNSMSSKRPSSIVISKTKPLYYQITSISYDDRDNKIWILGRNKAKSYGISPFGDVLQEINSVSTEQHTRGFTIIRQYGIKYACVAKCMLIAGYQCRLEFHKMDTGVLDESTLLRAVRTPTGLEAVQTVSAEHVVAAFSSGTFSEREKIQRIAGDFEDRYFKLKVPILETNFTITTNCLYFKVGSNWIIPRKRLFPFDEMKCGTRRKRSAIEKALANDVYTEELEKHDVRRRQALEESTCIYDIEGEALTGNYVYVIINNYSPKAK